MVRAAALILAAALCGPLSAVALERPKASKEAVPSPSEKPQGHLSCDGVDSSGNYTHHSIALYVKRALVDSDDYELFTSDVAYDIIGSVLMQKIIASATGQRPATNTVHADRLTGDYTITLFNPTGTDIKVTVVERGKCVAVQPKF